MGLVKRQRVLYNIGYFRNKEKYKASAKTGQKQWISENQEETFMKRETVIVLDFGGQYNQLIARRVRECNVYCEIYSYKTDLEKIKAMEPKGIIFTGGPNSVYLEDSPSYAKEIYDLGIPVLGICYGSQLMMYRLYIITGTNKTTIFYAGHGFPCLRRIFLSITVHTDWEH